MVYQVTSAISASSPANDQLETIFFLPLVGFYTGNKIPSPKKTSRETSTDLVSNSGNELWQIFSKDAAFPEKVYSLSGCVNLRQRETPAPGNPEAALMSPVYLIHGNICRAWLSPTHQHRFLGARLCRHPATWVPQVFIIQTTVFLYSVFWSRGGAEVCVWCFGHAQLPSPSVTAPHQTCPCQTPPPSTLLAPQLWVTAAASAVHTKTSVVLSFFDYTDN